MASFRLNTLISHPEQGESAATGNHSILALSNDRQFAAARSYTTWLRLTHNTGLSSGFPDRASLMV
ncbi:TPA: hypothetical protein JEL93_004592 [Salmonella enterica subsp. enterica serovar Taiping]|nr:hypothetical protein [Salmonella enterica subsp. enterica serovar Taiping]